MSAIPALRSSSPVDLAPADKDDDTSKEKRVARCTLNGHKAALCLSSGRLCAAAAASDAAHNLAASTFTEWQAAPLASVTGLLAGSVDRSYSADIAIAKGGTDAGRICALMAAAKTGTSSADLLDMAAVVKPKPLGLSSSKDALLKLENPYYATAAQLVKKVSDGALGSASRLSAEEIYEKVKLFEEYKHLTGETASTIPDIIESVVDESLLLTEAALSTGDRTFVFVRPKRDVNPMSHVSWSNNSVRRLAKGRKLVVERVVTREELVHALRRQKNISHLWIAAHGNCCSVSFDRDAEAKDDLLASQTRSWPVENFAAGASIILESCSTAASSCKQCIGFPLSFAEELHGVLEGKVAVTAAKEDIDGSDTTIKDGEVSFAVRDQAAFFLPSRRDVTVRYPAIRNGK